MRCGDGKEKRLRGIIFLGGRSDYSPEEVSLLGVPYVCCSYTNSYGTLPPESYSSVSIADEQEATARSASFTKTVTAASPC